MGFVVRPVDTYILETHILRKLTIVYNAFYGDKAFNVILIN
jgi:hypothetical protein